MIVAIAADTRQRPAFQKKPLNPGQDLVFVDSSSELYRLRDADLLVDCLYAGGDVPEPGRPLLLNSTVDTLRDLNLRGQVARFCAWNGFEGRITWEIAINDGSDAGWLEQLMAKAGWNYRLVADQPGLISPRIVSMIINEAYFALSENISTREQIDIAMKLGTNYPFGPFEWAEKIGLGRVKALLERLAETDCRYKPCQAMYA